MADVDGSDAEVHLRKGEATGGVWTLTDLIEKGRRRDTAARVVRSVKTAQLCLKEGAAGVRSLRCPVPQMSEE